MRRSRHRIAGQRDQVPAFRAEGEKELSRLPVPKGIRQQERRIGGLHSLHFEPLQLRYAHKIVLYFHGGGYITGSAKGHASLGGKLAKETGIPHLVVDYRLAPENPFPAASDDAMAAYRYLLEEERYNPKDIILMGDSAGGGLALGLLLRLKDEERPLPLCAVVLSPLVDLTLSGDSMKERAARDPLLEPHKLASWSQWYGGTADLEHPWMSPLFGDLSNLPPILVQVGTDEILYSDSIRFAKAAMAQGVDLTLYVEDKAPHVWQMFWSLLPRAKAAIANIAEYLDQQIAKHEPTHDWKSLDEL